MYCEATFPAASKTRNLLGPTLYFIYFILQATHCYFSNVLILSTFKEFVSVSIVNGVFFLQVPFNKVISLLKMFNFIFIPLFNRRSRFHSLL